VKKKYMYEIKYHPEEISGLSFLVTGGGGFIGSNIVEYLLKFGAKHVRVLDNLSNGSRSRNIQPFKKFDNYKFIEGDITDLSACLKACEGIDYVLHQAAIGSVPRSIEFPLRTHHSNATGFLNMLEAAKANGVKRMVYASSSSVYGDSMQLPKVEENIGNPISPYAVSKLTNELYAHVFHLCYGLELIGLRYFNVFGPRQDPYGAYAAVIPLFAKAMIQGEQPVLNGDGSQTRDFTFVENVVQANIKSVFSEHPLAVNHVLNVGTHSRVSLLELVDTLNELLGTNEVASHRPPRGGDIQDSFANIDKAQELLNYDPKFDLKEGLQCTLGWYKELFEKEN
jgi:UDP-N-acetylglucosamine 4-epimerase